MYMWLCMSASKKCGIKNEGNVKTVNDCKIWKSSTRTFTMILFVVIK